MARGDVKYTGGGRSGGWGSSDSYDDEGRGYSKELYERFVRLYNSSTANLFDAKVITDDFIKLLICKTTYRYNVHDFSEGVNWDSWDGSGDGRIRRDIIKSSGERNWQKFVARVNQIREQERDEDWIAQLANRISNWHWKQEYQLRRDEAREALVLKRTEEVAEWRKESDLTVGMIQSDFTTAIQMKEAYYQRQGDWLDDPVSAYTTGYGFGEEVRSPGGIKLQITVSLDLSNSMRMNYIAKAALKTFVNLNLALEKLAEEHPQDIFTCAFTFSEDTSEWVNGNYAERFGRLAKRIDLIKSSLEQLDEKYGDAHLGVMDRFYNADEYNLFSGQDTWMYPLFEEIEKWENAESDNGAMRLDLIISDAVLEHPSDIRQSDIIQERRDGSLQTVILNLMPEKDWHGGALPRRCVQYPVNVENLAGMARTIISEFLQVYV